MQNKVITILVSTALLGTAVACKDRKSEDTGGNHGNYASAPLTKKTPLDEAVTGTGDRDRYETTARVDSNAAMDSNVPGPTTRDGTGAGTAIARKDIDDARSTYGVNTSGADAIAHFNASGANSLRGIVSVDGEKVTVAIAEAVPGKYIVELSEQSRCEPQGSVVGTPGPTRTAQRVPGMNTDGAGGAPDRLGVSGEGTHELTKGDNVLGTLLVGQDGQGRLETSIDPALTAGGGLQDQTIVIKSVDGRDISTGQLRGPIACGELNDEHGA